MDIPLLFKMKIFLVILLLFCISFQIIETGNCFKKQTYQTESRKTYCKYIKYIGYRVTFLVAVKKMDDQINVNSAIDRKLLPRLEDTQLATLHFGHLFSTEVLVFIMLGIRNTIAISPAPGNSATYHFLGLPIPVEIPEMYTAEPGDGKEDSQIRSQDSDRQRQNIINLQNFIEEYKQIYGQEYFQLYRNVLGHRVNFHFEHIPSLAQLIANVRYFLVNHSEISTYPRPINDKIGFIIGGIAFGENSFQKFHDKIIENREIEPVWRDYSDNCIVIFSLGTFSNFKGMSIHQLSTMLEVFNQQQNCQFIIRGVKYLQELINNYNYIPNNLHIFSEKIDLKGILEMDTRKEQKDLQNNYIIKI
ncbi:hypothetical protein Mgra_00002838 [Meloidogyne graminicola]|uniref:Glucuronosyltransferase n=1 Tax=Meloidogyne graminicola TaxID=189291 RepID=A0A8S9ZVB5_9BILA|nr:hypothetical protein Mgra_00002838 [Meloidogyne graminicola]